MIWVAQYPLLICCKAAWACARSPSWGSLCRLIFPLRELSLEGRLTAQRNYAPRRSAGQSTAGRMWCRGRSKQCLGTLSDGQCVTLATRIARRTVAELWWPRRGSGRGAFDDAECPRCGDHVGETEAG